MRLARRWFYGWLTVAATTITSLLVLDWSVPQPAPSGSGIAHVVTAIARAESRAVQPVPIRVERQSASTPPASLLFDGGGKATENQQASQALPEKTETRSAGAKNGFRLPPLEYLWQGEVGLIIAELRRRYSIAFVLVPAGKIDHVLVSWDGRTSIRITRDGYQQLLARTSNLYATLPAGPETDRIREQLLRQVCASGSTYTLAFLAGRAMSAEIAQQLLELSDRNRFDLKRLARARVTVSTTVPGQLKLRVEVPNGERS